MTFREAIEQLARRPTRRDVAQEAGVSYHSVRQALLPETSPAHRGAPPGWEEAVGALAEREGIRLLALASTIKGDEVDLRARGRASRAATETFHTATGSVAGVGQFATGLRIPKDAGPDDLQNMADAARTTARTLSRLAVELDRITPDAGTDE